MAKARRAKVQLLYNQKSAEQTAPYLGSFTYTDVASGASDSISIQFNDPDRRWINSWFPAKGDKLTPTILFEDWEQEGYTKALKCGAFVVDDFSFAGGPIKMTLDALAMPSTSGFKATERTNTYEGALLQSIGLQIAKRNGLQLFYEPKWDVSLESVEQDKQTDCTFFNDLLVKYGLALKIYNDRLVVFDEAVYEEKPVVATLTEADFEPNWRFNTTLVGTYTGVKYSYTPSKKKKTFSVDIGDVTGGRVLTCNEAANTLAEGTLIAVAAINNANKNTTTMEITLKGNWHIVATSCIQIEGLGKLDGKYYVEKAVTTVSPTGGTKQKLSIRKVEKRFVKAPPAAEPTKTRQSSSKKEQKKQQDKAKQATTSKRPTGRDPSTKKVGTGKAAPIVKGEKVTSITKPLSGNNVPTAQQKLVEAVKQSIKAVEDAVKKASGITTTTTANRPVSHAKKVGTGTATVKTAASRPAGKDPATKKVGTGTATVPVSKKAAPVVKKTTGGASGSTGGKKIANLTKNSVK